MARIVFHVDMDAFYAGVEVRDNPGLAGLPLVVGADPRGGRGRGVVCTASYEARRYGIRSAMPISQAWRLAPHATFVRPNFSKYGPASDAVMAVLESYADALEIVGMDEAYLDVTDRTGGDWAMARALAHSLQAAVRRATGLSCSVGVAPNKSLAKIASDRRKPHGVTLVQPDNVRAFLDPLPVRAANGCGPKTAQALHDFGIVTIGQLAATPRPQLERAFGSHGAWLWTVAQGLDDRRVDGDHGPRKSIGNETTFPRDEADGQRVLATATQLLDESLERTSDGDGRAFSTIAVKVRYKGFVTITRANTAPMPYEPGQSDAVARARLAIQSLLAPLLDGRAVRLVGIRLSGFRKRTGQQPLGTYGMCCTPLPGAGAFTIASQLGHATGARRGFDPGGLRWAALDAF